MSSVYMIVFTVGLAVQILAVAGECENGTVTLVPFEDMTPDKGYVQYCMEGKWRDLCSSTFSRVEANVICRQLGYSDQGAKKSNKGNVTPQMNGGDYFNFDSGSCAGRESALTECAGIKESSTCNYNRGWVNCTLPSCKDQDIRLVNGTSYREGRVEVCVDGRWGTVCYNQELAGTVCQQLGFAYQGVRATGIIFPGPKANCAINNRELSCPTITELGTCKGLTVECARSNCSNGNCTIVDCPVTETNTDIQSTNKLDSVTNKTEQESINSYIIISLGAVIGLLALLELTTVIGCISCIARLRGHSHKTREITSISYHNPKSSHTLERDIVVVPNDAVSHATSNEAKQTNNKATGSYETIDTNLAVIQGYEPILPHNEIIADYDTIETARDAVVQYSNTATVKDETIGGYETVDTNNEGGIDGYDYIVSRNSPPPIVPPYQPDTPPPVGGVSENNTSDYIYAVVDKSRKRKLSQE